jgi:hypothetical protein
MSRYQPHLIGISCRCGASWSGEDRMHCGSGCHRTFDSIELWDAHRDDDRCVHPRTLGLVETKNHIWYLPEGAALMDRRRVG